MNGSISRRQFGQGLVAGAALSSAGAARARTVTQQQVSPHRFIHPGVLQNHSDLEFMKARVLAGQPPWKDAWERMLLDPSSLLSFTAQPSAHVFRGSYGAGQKGVNELNASVDAAHNHVLQWFVTRKPEHANKVSDVLDAWATVLSDFGGNDAMLLAGWTGGALANTAEILRSTYPSWEILRQERFKRMLMAVYVPLLRNFFPEANGNWDAAMMHSLLGIAVFCEDRELMSEVLEHYKLGSGTAGITRYVYPNGQCEESTRDQAHTQLGLGYFALTARIASKQGIDLFGEADNRLALGFEYTSRYMIGETVWAFGTISQQNRDRIDDFYEAALQHFRYDRGIAMPFTEQAAAKARNKSRGVLTMYRGEPYGAKALLPATESSQIAVKPGAPIEGANSPGIKPGENIQAALDSAAAGATIQIVSGLHALTAALRIRSEVTLAGTGRDCILWLEENLAGPVLVAGEDDLHDVVLRDFVVEAATLSKPTRDPNQDARPRRSQLALQRAGIALIANGPGKMHGVRMERLTVTHATMSAVELFGVDSVEIVSCDFAGSGGTVSPGVGQHHNLKITRAVRVRVTSSRLADSLCSCGLCAQFVEHLTLTDCEIARNEGDGIRLLECNGVEIRKCLLEGNAGKAVQEDHPVVKAVQKENLLRNNANGANPILRA